MKEETVEVNLEKVRIGKQEIEMIAILEYHFRFKFLGGMQTENMK